MVARPKTYLGDRFVAGVGVSNPSEETNVCFECSVLSGRNFFNGTIPSPEVSYLMYVCH